MPSPRTGLAARNPRSRSSRCPSGTARPASTPTTVGRRKSSLGSAASCGSTGISVGRGTRRRRVSSSGCQGFIETNFEPGRVTRRTDPRIQGRSMNRINAPHTHRCPRTVLSITCGAGPIGLTVQAT